MEILLLTPFYIHLSIIQEEEPLRTNCFSRERYVTVFIATSCFPCDIKVSLSRNVTFSVSSRFKQFWFSRCQQWNRHSSWIERGGKWLVSNERLTSGKFRIISFILCFCVWTIWFRVVSECGSHRKCTSGGKSCIMNIRLKLGSIDPQKLLKFKLSSYSRLSVYPQLLVVTPKLIPFYWPILGKIIRKLKPFIHSVPCYKYI